MTDTRLSTADLTAAELAAVAQALYAVQQDILIRACQADRAARRVQNREMEDAEGRRLLVEARKWLGEGVREQAA